MKLKKLLKLIIYITGFVFIFPVLGIDNLQSGDTVIEGETLENMLDQRIKASGNALLQKGNKTIRANTITFDQNSNTLQAQGNVVIESGKTEIKGDMLDLSVDDTIGNIPNATFTTDSTNKSKINQSIKGTTKNLFLEGENKIKLNNAAITTCEVGKNDWFIKGSEININNKSKSVEAKNARMEFKGVPLLYSPYMDFSFNNQRKSGWLSPTWGTTTKSGFQFRAPYYFNISPNQDATLTPRYLGKRGLQIGGEYRYMEDNYQGTTNVEFLNNDYMTNTERYLINLKHQQQFSENLSGSLRIEKVSDNDYFTDMSTLISSTSRVVLPQEISLNYNNSGWNGNLLVQKFQSLTTSSPYEKLPSLTLSRNDEFKNFNTTTYFNLTEFDANNSHNRYIENYGYFNAGDMKPTGSRFIYNQSIETAFENSYSYIKPKATVNFRSYETNHSDRTQSEQITIPTFSIDSGLYFDSKQQELFNQKFTQTIEPRLFYSYTPYQNQSMLPVYDTRLMDLNIYNIFSENQFIGYDRILDSNQVTAGLTSRFISDKNVENLSLTVAQRFYFSDRNVLNDPIYSVGGENLRRASSDFLFGANARIYDHLNFKALTQYNPEQNSTKRVQYGFKYNPGEGKILRFDYRFLENAATDTSRIKNINLAGQWPLGNGYYAVGRYNFDLLESKPIETLGGLEYDAGCWTSRVVLHRLSLITDEGDPNYTLWFQLELGGLGSIGSGKARKLDQVLMRNVPGAGWANSFSDETRRENFD